MDREILHKKWLADEITPTELSKIEAFDDFKLSKKILLEATKFKANAEHSHNGYDALKIKLANNKKSQSKYLKFVLPLAAMLVVALGIFTLWGPNNETVFETGLSNTKIITLPDQSTVTLNAESKLAYNSETWESERSLTLYGEAFFEVVKGSTFTVNTKDGSIQVLGTKFNVNTRKDYFTVSCYEGKVLVKSGLLDQNLFKNNSVSVINGLVHLNTIQSESPTWLQHYITFNNVTFDIVISELERQYAIKITKNSVVLNRVFSGSFTHQDVKEALTSITAPMKLNYQFLSSNQVEIYE